MPTEVTELLIRAKLDGVAEAKRRMDELATAVETTDAKVTRSGKSFEALRVGLDATAEVAARTARANKVLADSLATIERAVTTGATTRAEADSLIAAATMKRDEAVRKAQASLAASAAQAQGAATAHAALTTTTNQSSAAMRQLAIQGVQTASSLASGMPVTTTLVQQGHQVVDIMLAQGQGMGLLGAAARGVASALLSPIGVTVALGAAMAATVAHAAALEAEARALSIGLRAVGRDGELAASGLQAYVRVLQQGGIGRADASAIVGGLSRNPGLSAAGIGQVAGLTADTATALGSDPQAAAKLLGAAASGSYSAIKQLDDELNILTADERLSIRTMLEHGDRVDAVGKVMDSLKQRVQGLNKDALSPMAMAFRDLGNGWDDFVEKVTKSGPVKTYLEYIAGIVGGAAKLIGSSGDAGASPHDAEIAQLQRALAATPAAGMNSPAAISGRERLNALLALRNLAGVGQSPNDVGGSSLPGAAEGQRQNKELEDARVALANARRLAGAGPAGQASMAATIAAENEAREKKLTGLAREELIRLRVAEATTKEGAARAADVQALLAQATGEMALVRASEEGRAAMLRAQAAAEAHAKALSEDSVNEKALAEAILNRNAAQEAAKGAQTLLDLNEQVAATRALAEAYKAGDGPAYYAELADKTRQATVNLVAARDAATDPAIKAALTVEVIKIREGVEERQKENALLDARRRLLTGEGVLADLKLETSLIGANAEYRERELAAMRTTRALVEGKQAPDANSLTDTQKALVDQSRTIASANYALKQQQSLYDGIAQSATQAFDQVGQAITNAFIGGQKEAVNWGNVMRGVVASVLQQVIKLGVVNPLINAVLSPSTPLPSVNLLGGFGLGGSSGGASSGSSGGIGSILSNIPGVTSVGQFLGGSGGWSSFFTNTAIGFGLGTFANSMVRGNSTNGMIGAGLGSVLLGPLGGLAGGLIGGALGPGKAHHGWNIDVGANASGLLGITSSASDKYDIAGELQSVQAEIDAVNSVLSANRIKASIYGGAVPNLILGGNNAVSQPGSLSAAFSALSFSANDNALNGALSGRSFSSAQGLADFTTFFTTTMPTLIGGRGSLADAVSNLNKNFDEAVAKAHEYGLAEGDLAAARERQIGAARAAANLARDQSEAALDARILAAGGNSAAAALLGFDTSATQQRATLAKQLTDAFGDAYSATDEYARIMGKLTTALDAERVNLVNGPRLNAQGQVAGVMANLATFAAGLSTSSASPLSPMAQLGAARRGFDAVAGAAAAGDYNSLLRVQDYATSYLSISRNVNGSGLRYAQDFEHVIASLQGVGSVNTDALTTSAMAALAQNQTDQMVAAVARLQGEVAALRLDMRQAAVAPSRIAA